MTPQYKTFEFPINPASPVPYGIDVAHYPGSLHKALLIIVWKWGGTEGYQNKYITIASKIVEKFWFHVFVVENPWISRDDPRLFVDSAMQFVDHEMCELGEEDYELYAMGFSAGGHFVWRFAPNYPQVTKILMINPVLSINFSKLKKSLLAFSWISILVQGDLDFDFFYNPLLSQLENTKVVVLPGVDHQFTNPWGLEQFIWLAEEYLF